ncbi:MAG: LytR/AlgR family response regulator transcription factor [Kofleriaceae bacterium]
MRVLIVDDEPLARDGVRLLLANDPDVSAITDARNGHEAIAEIRERRPDLVFLDVQMPELDGFGVVAAIGAAELPATVFVTAHDRFAIQAFEVHAVDYLLKPIRRDRFAQALARAKARLRHPDPAQLRELLAALAPPPLRAPRRLAVRTSGKTVLVDLDDVDWIGAAENYVELHAGRAVHLLQVTMTGLERSLDPAEFVRIHRSTIVKIAQIAELAAAPGGSGEYVVMLRDGTKLRSGRTYAERLRALAANPF